MKNEAETKKKEKPAWRVAEWEQVMRQAESQHGVVTRKQILTAGFSTKDWNRLLRLGWVLPATRGIYEILPSMGWHERQLQSAMLLAGDGAVVSHRAAARRYGLWGINGNPVELTVPKGRRVGARHALMYEAALEPADVVILRGLKTTSLAKTVVDLATISDADSLAAALEMARRRHPKVLEQLEERLKSAGDDDASTLLRELLLETKLRQAPLDSVVEVWAWRWMLEARLELPEAHYRLSLPKGPTVTLDFAWPKEKVAMELQGFAYHGSRDAFEKDNRRHSALSKAGWIIIYVTYRRLMDAFHDVLVELRTILADRRVPQTTAR